MDSPITRNEIEQCTRLRDSLKEKGLKLTLSQMEPREFDYTRRRFREALATHIDWMERQLGEAQHGGAITDKPER